MNAESATINSATRTSSRSFPRFWCWWSYSVALLAGVLVVVGSVGTVIEFRAIHEYELSRSIPLSEQTRFWQQLFNNLVWDWIVIEQGHDDTFLNPWLDNSAIFALFLILGLFLGFCVSIGKLLWIATAKLRE